MPWISISTKEFPRASFETHVRDSSPLSFRFATQSIMRAFTRSRTHTEHHPFRPTHPPLSSLYSSSSSSTMFSRSSVSAGWASGFPVGREDGSGITWKLTILIKMFYASPSSGMNFLMPPSRAGDWAKASWHTFLLRSVLFCWDGDAAARLFTIFEVCVELNSIPSDFRSNNTRLSSETDKTSLSTTLFEAYWMKRSKWVK